MKKRGRPIDLTIVSQAVRKSRNLLEIQIENLKKSGLRRLNPNPNRSKKRDSNDVSMLFRMVERPVIRSTLTPVTEKLNLAPFYNSA
jgi:hypothetical protein